MTLPRPLRRIEALDGGEAAIQRAVFQHCGWRSAPDVFAFHVPNGGARRRIEAAILRGLGTTPGIPDVIAVKAGRVFGVRAQIGGRPSQRSAEGYARGHAGGRGGGGRCRGAGRRACVA
jgi:hypothetical protein